MTPKKWLTLLMAVAMTACLSVPAALAEDTDAFLSQLEGAYDELFTTICAPEYDQIWLDACAPFVDADNAQAYVDVLKAACVGERLGEEAIATYTAAPEAAQFNCFFIQNVAQITVAGNRISGVDMEGNTVFDHAYRYVGDDELPGFASFRVYESEDADSGEFTYFSFAPDTPAETYHIEFRYGSDREALSRLMEGPYAYWLAAGIMTPYAQEDIVNVVTLFCEENLETAAEDAA